MCWISQSRAETRALAQGLAAALRTADVAGRAGPAGLAEALRTADVAGRAGPAGPSDALRTADVVDVAGIAGAAGRAGAVGPAGEAAPAVPGAAPAAQDEAEEAEEALVVALAGPLGAGKTLFATGVAEALGIDPAWLQSPTFAIAVEFPLPPGASHQRLVHADFYRLESADELELAGLTDWLAAGTLLLVEWADRFADALPEKRLELRIDPEGENARRLRARAQGAVAKAVLERWREQCP